MGTGVRETPDRIAAVSVGVLWGKRHRDTRPEMLPVTEVGVLVIEDPIDNPVVSTELLLSDNDLFDVPDRLTELGLPIVTYNSHRFDWPALNAVTPVDSLIPRTIDLYTALYPLASDIVDAEGVSAFPVHGEYGVLHPHRVAETNLGYIPGGDSPLGEAELAAALWRHLLIYERAITGGRARMLTDDGLAHLRGREPAFASAEEWRAMLEERPEPTPYRRRSRHPVTFPRIDQRYV